MKQSKIRRVFREKLAITDEKILHENFLLWEYKERMEERVKYLSSTDVLTELPNRKMLISELDLLIQRTRSFAVVFIDIDDFKRINDSRGHNIGDLLLKAVVVRINLLLKKEDLMGRLGGDEFALIIRNINEELGIFKYVERIRTALLEIFIIENIEYSISASFGISIFPCHGIDSSELLKGADLALHKSKDYGKNKINFYKKEMNEAILRKIELENRLGLALKNKEIYLQFQPQYCAETKELRGFEALARWDSPELGFVSPLDFIPIAEVTGYIVPMGEWVIRTVCKMINYIHNTYHLKIVISVNVSAVQIMDSSFVTMVKNIIEEEKIGAEQLEIEITESVFISSMEYVVGIISELKEMGVRIALDDFGTGYSSLSYLQKLPIDTLKIDKSFIDSIGDIDAEQQITGAIISLGHKMSIAVVAEGVEHENQLEYLNKQNCDSIQGFLWGKPLNEKDLFQLLHQLNLSNTKKDRTCSDLYC